MIIYGRDMPSEVRCHGDLGIGYPVPSSSRPLNDTFVWGSAIFGQDEVI